MVAGALLAVGMVNCGVRNECDPERPAWVTCWLKAYMPKEGPTGNEMLNRELG